MTALVDGLDHKAEIRQLFTEYTDMLVALDPAFAGYLTLQHFDAEVADLALKYGPPGGRLWLALANGRPAGCIALRQLDDTRCEMKRLYVRPAYRGLGLGRQLAEQSIAVARNIGYRQMLLDTLPPLESAIRLYRSLGFYEIPCYNDSPIDRTYFFRLDL